MSLTHLFTYKYVKRFYLARFISNFGNGISPVALAFGILHLRNGSAGLLGLVLTVGTLGLLVMVPFGGVIADKFGRIRMASLVDTWGGLVLIVQAIWFMTGHVPLLVLILCNLNFGLMWGIFWPAMAGILPSMVGEKDLQTANATNQLFSNIAYVIGAACAGFLVTIFGSGTALLIDAITFVISGSIVFSFRKSDTGKNEEGESLVADLKHGWKTFLSYRWIVVVVGGFSFIVMAWAAGESVLGPLIALKYFNGAKSWAFVMTCSSVGLIAGSLIALKIRLKYPMRTLMAMTLFLAVYMWSLAKPQSLIFIGICSFFWGLTLDMWGSIWSTALQRSVPRQALSRVSSFDALGSLIFRPVGLAIAAPISTLFGLRHTMEYIAIFVALCVVVVLVDPQVRNMTMPNMPASGEE
jgi:MFS family permease